jgi:DNA repair exonuclease SbcCD ATPase subunit
MLQRKVHILLLFTVALLIAGCSILTPKEPLLSAFEKMVEYEEEFNEQQKPLVELERKEKEIYDQIMSLGMKEFPKILKLSEEGLEIIEKREERIKKEYESIQLARKQLEVVRKEISLLPDIAIKEEAIRLAKLLENRYAAYDQLYNSYRQALKLETDLYQMFQNKHLTLEQLENQVAKINSAYDDIRKANEQFNRYTTQYNEEKKVLFNKLR